MRDAGGHRFPRAVRVLPARPLRAPEIMELRNALALQGLLVLDTEIGDRRSYARAVSSDRAAPVSQRSPSIRLREPHYSLPKLGSVWRYLTVAAGQLHAFVQADVPGALTNSDLLEAAIHVAPRTRHHGAPLYPGPVRRLDGVDRARNGGCHGEGMAPELRQRRSGCPMPGKRQAGRRFLMRPSRLLRAPALRPSGQLRCSRRSCVRSGPAKEKYLALRSRTKALDACF
jgi:hypothetical protein